MAKLICPNVFINLDFLRVVIQRYDPGSRAVLVGNGVVMIKITKDYISSVFNLNPAASNEIDLNALKEGYNTVKCGYITFNFHKHKPKGVEGKLVKISDR